MTEPPGTEEDPRRWRRWGLVLGLVGVALLAAGLSLLAVALPAGRGGPVVGAGWLLTMTGVAAAAIGFRAHAYYGRRLEGLGERGSRRPRGGTRAGEPLYNAAPLEAPPRR